MRVDFLDIVRDQVDGDADDAEALFNAEFALMTGELVHLLPAVVRALGGELANMAVESQVTADDPPF